MAHRGCRPLLVAALLLIVSISAVSGSRNVPPVLVAAASGEIEIDTDANGPPKLAAPAAPAANTTTVPAASVKAAAPLPAAAGNNLTVSTANKHDADKTHHNKHTHKHDKGEHKQHASGAYSSGASDADSDAADSDDDSSSGSHSGKHGSKHAHHSHDKKSGDSGHSADDADVEEEEEGKGTTHKHHSHHTKGSHHNKGSSSSGGSSSGSGGSGKHSSHKGKKGHAKDVVEAEDEEADDADAGLMNADDMDDDELGEGDATGANGNSNGGGNSGNAGGNGNANAGGNGGGNGGGDSNTAYEIEVSPPATAYSQEDKPEHKAHTHGHDHSHKKAKSHHKASTTTSDDADDEEEELEEVDSHDNSSSDADDVEEEDSGSDKKKKHHSGSHTHSKKHSKGKSHHKGHGKGGSASHSGHKHPRYPLKPAEDEDGSSGSSGGGGSGSSGSGSSGSYSHSSPYSGSASGEEEEPEGDYGSSTDIDSWSKGHKKDKKHGGGDSGSKHGHHKHAHKASSKAAKLQALHSNEDSPVGQPAGEILNTFVAAGSCTWRDLAAASSASNSGGSSSSLGESPYFPTLRGPRRKAGSSYSAGGAGVTDATCALPINSTTCDKDKGFYGTCDGDAYTLPSDETLLVGPAEGTSEPNQKYVLHAVNRHAEIFLAHSNGTLCKSGSLGNTKVSLQQLMSVTQCSSVASLVAGEPTGYYDIQSRRYVLVWLATAPAQDAEPLLFVAVSASSDPLGTWTVKALRVRPSAATFKCSAGGHAHGHGSEPFFANYPQVTYSGEGVFVSLGLICNSRSSSTCQASLADSFRSAIFAFSKTALYSAAASATSTSTSTDGNSGSGSGSGSSDSHHSKHDSKHDGSSHDSKHDGSHESKHDSKHDSSSGSTTTTTATTTTVSAAVFIVSKAWYRSVSASSSVVLGDSLNNFAQPVKPQSLEDVFNGPYFVQKVDDSFMSIATISGGSLTGMASGGVQAAPRLSAGVFARGFHFSNGGAYEGLNAMSQPETDIMLSTGDTGMVGRRYAVRSYGATLYQGSIYLTTSEFYGAGHSRTPSIYWAIVEPNSLATGAIVVQGSGVIASKDGLSLAFPVIAALTSGDGAVVAFSYSTSGEVAGVGPGYAGVATTTIRNFGKSGSRASIDIVKAGEGSVTIPAVHDTLQRWGDYSAAQVADGKMWFAVPCTKLAGGHDPLVDAAYGSWISTKHLE